MSKKGVHDGLVIALSWPNTNCKQTGAWYDPLMRILRFNRGGYYKVGHAAIVVITYSTGICQYYDFGRYHAPLGHGRVRDAFSDHDLIIKTKARFSEQLELINETEILKEILQNSSCHGHGYLLSVTQKAITSRAIARINWFQKRIFIPYGPLIWNGTNCSRFVASVLHHSGLIWRQRIALICQPTISPSPKYNVLAMGGKFTITEEERVFEKEAFELQLATV